MSGPTAHSELGASVAHRWLPCPGSVRMSRGIPNYDNIHSITGTAAHALGEIGIVEEGDLNDYLGVDLAIDGKSVDSVEVTEDMIEAVQVYVSYCLALKREPGALYWIEQQFNLAELDPPADMFGTSDFDAYLPAIRTLEVVDYKHGSGVVVEVKGNKQLRYYGLGALLKIMREHPELEIEEVKITIIQPRAAHPDGPIRSETLSVLDLLAFARELMEGAKATQAPDAPLVAGSHCRFCPASPVCPAQREQAQALAQVTFADMPVDLPPAPEALPAEIFDDIYSKLPLLRDWIRAMDAHAMRQAEAGMPPTGTKLVAKRATRKWVDEKVVEEYLVSQIGLGPADYYVEKLKSPAQIEKLVGKKTLPTDLYEKKSSGYTLVPEHDPRPAIALNPGDVFPALTAGDDE